MTKAPMPIPTRSHEAPSILQEYDFDQSIGYWIILASQAYQKALNNELAPHGITFRQSQVLGWLALEGELSQAELAARMLIEPPTLVGVLDRMERDGLISRVGFAGRPPLQADPCQSGGALVWGKVVECARARARRGGCRADVRNEVKLLIGTLQKVIDNVSVSSSGLVSDGLNAECGSGARRPT